MDYQVVRIIEIILKLIFFGLSFYSLQCLRIDVFKKGFVLQIQLFYIFVSMALAQLCTDFLMSLWIQYIQ